MERVNAFSLYCGQKLLGKGDGNELISPLSLYFAFAMMAAGTDPGQPRDSLLEFMHAGSEEELNGICLPLLEDAEEAYGLLLSNSLWASEKYVINPDYVDKVKANYRASARNVDFGDPETGARISRWVEESTNHLISPKLKFDDSTILTIINTLYFGRAWTTKFEPRSTAPGKFHLRNGSTVTAEFMSRSILGNYASLDSCRSISLELDDCCEMRLVLPDEGTDAAEILASIETYEEAMETSPDRYADIQLKLPKFEFQTHFDLMEKAGLLGIDQTLDELTFDRISPNIPELNSILHDTKIKVDEEGVEAAAMTEIVFALGCSLPPTPEEKITLTFDRPFLFGIFDRVLGTWLFLGLCSDPTRQ